MLGVLLVALLATPLLIRSYRRAIVHAPSAAGPVADAKARYGFAFTESAKAAGHRLHARGADARPASSRTSCRRWRRWAPAVAIVDVDADGHADLYVTNSKEGSKNRLYRNKGDGTFEDVAERVGLAALNEPGTGVSMGSGLGRLRQRRLRGPARLQVGPAGAVPQRRRPGASRASASAPACRRWANINAAVWLDYDRDGRLDLFLGGYFAEHVEPLEARRRRR